MVIPDVFLVVVPDAVVAPDVVVVPDAVAVVAAEVEDVEVVVEAKAKIKYFPDRITIQWHLTDECNCRCKHCYQTSYLDKGGDYSTLLNYLYKLEDFVLQCSSNRKISAHINFTGGEPFLKTGFMDLLQEVNKRHVFSFGILSNGFLLADADLLKLAALGPKFIQISLEGNEVMNDSIRGNGSYNSVIKALKSYKKLNIPVLISFTVNAKNYTSFPEVVKVARRYKAYKVWTDRYLPMGNGDDLVMNTNQVKDFFQTLLQEQKKKLFTFFSKTVVSSSRALQFINSGGEPYQCSAGTTLLAILPNGDVLPCRRLPIKMGNLNDNNLFDLYQNHHLLQDLRKTDNLDKDCSLCYYRTSCNGGLKCLSYAIYGDYHRKDPNCWI